MRSLPLLTRPTARARRPTPAPQEATTTSLEADRAARTRAVEALLANAGGAASTAENYAALAALYARDATASEVASSSA
jgi:hypothetical protein